MPDLKGMWANPIQRALLVRSAYRLVVLVVGFFMARGTITIAPEDWTTAQDILQGLGALMAGGAIVAPSRSTPALEAVVATQVKTTSLTPEAQAVEKATVADPAPAPKGKH